MKDRKSVMKHAAYVKFKDGDDFTTHQLKDRQQAKDIVDIFRTMEQVEESYIVTKEELVNHKS